MLLFYRVVMEMEQGNRRAVGVYSCLFSELVDWRNAASSSLNSLNGSGATSSSKNSMTGGGESKVTPKRNNVVTIIQELQALVGPDRG